MIFLQVNIQHYTIVVYVGGFVFATYFCLNERTSPVFLMLKEWILFIGMLCRIPDFDHLTTERSNHVTPRYQNRT